MLSHFTASDRAANIPEFVNVEPGAIASIREAFVDDISYARAGEAFMRAAEWQNAEREFKKALRINPENGPAHLNLGVVLIQRGAPDDGAQHLREAIRIIPQSVAARINLGALLTNQRNAGEGAVLLAEAVDLAPGDVKAHFNLAVARTQERRYDEADTHYRETLRLDPRHAGAQFNLGVILARRGKEREAAEQYSAALKLESNHVGALEALARMLITTRDLDLRDSARAVTLASRLCQLTGYQQVGPLLLLADGQLEAGHGADGVQVLEKARRLALAQGKKKAADTIGARIDTLRENQP